MSLLTNIEINQEYRSDDGSSLVGFYIACLENSVRFDRSAGYFTSAGIAQAAQGFSNFIDRGGKIRLIVSPSFNEEDFKAIIDGYMERRKVIENSMIRSIETIKFGVEKDRFEALCWLVANERLDIKVAIKTDKEGKIQSGIYHEKMGLFYDSDSNAVAFSGSANESQGGWVDNFESIDTFISWGEQNDLNRVKNKKKNFEKLWNNGTDLLDVVDIPEAVVRKLISKAPSVKPKKEEPLNIDLDISSIHEDIGIRYPEWLKKNGLREYQETIIELWKSSERKGIFSMATGTGKTITALAAATDLYYDINKLLVVICCPNSVLVDQWNKEAKQFNFDPILAIENYKKWNPQIKKMRRFFQKDLINIGMIITNKQTMFSSNTKADFLGLLNKFDDLPILFIADEVHNLGSENIRDKLPENFSFRIGLTATPKRYFDETGTKSIYKYFGDPTPIDPPIDLKFAIENNYLCPYKYYPSIVYLSDDETYEYHKLTKEINKLRFYRDPDDEGLKLKYQLRVNILNNAINKISVFEEILEKVGKLTKTLFYCSPDQIDLVSEILISKYGYHVNQITFHDRKNYNQIIDNFSKGRTDALCAIAVIDEGLDVPAAENAFFLSSSGNEKQFIQRRGRVLRKSDNKEFAKLFDFIVLPNGNIEENTNIVKKALEREIVRFQEFSNLAINSLEAKETVLKIALDNNIVL